MQHSSLNVYNSKVFHYLFFISHVDLNQTLVVMAKYWENNFLYNIGCVDLLSHFMKVKCDFWTYIFCVVLVTQGIPAMGVKRALGNQHHAEKLSPKIALHFHKVRK